MFDIDVNILDGLRMVNILPEEVTSIIVRADCIEVSTHSDTKSLTLNHLGVTNPFHNTDMSLFKSLRTVKFNFPDNTYDINEWKNTLNATYKNMPKAITFSLVNKTHVLSVLSNELGNKTFRDNEFVQPKPVVAEEDADDEDYDNEYDEDYDEDDDEDEDDEDYDYADDYDEDDEVDEDDDDEEEDYADDYDENGEIEDDGDDDEEEEQQTTTSQQQVQSTSPVGTQKETELMAYAQQLTNTIIDMYNKIYPQCYVQRPYGILTTSGVLTYDKESQSIGRIQNGLDNFIISAYTKYVSADSTVKQLNSMQLGEAISAKGLLYNYIPLLQAEIAYGIKRVNGKVETVNNWGDYTTYLNGVIKNVVYSLLKTRKTAFDIAFQTQVVAMFTNTCILLEYDISKALHVVYKFSNCKIDLGDFIVDNAPSLFAQQGEVISKPKPTGEYSRLLFALNPKNYHSEILFAYKMYQQVIASGATPSAKEMIIGRTLDGNEMKLDLENRQNIIGAIMAGPRSGKGVLTLSILAGLMAHEKDGKTIPFIYCDGKPEMSATLWEMERELQSQGIDAKILAIEGLNKCTDDGVGPNRGNKIVNGRSVWDFGRNLPDGLDLEGISVIPYLKMMQLFSAMAKGSFESIPSYTTRFARIMLVLDETIAIKGQYNDLCSSLYKFLKANKPSGKKEPSEEYLYVHRLATVLTHMEDIKAFSLSGQMTSKFVGTLVSEGPRKGFGVMQIGQFTTPGLWLGVQPSEWSKNPFGFLMKNASWRILGKNSGQSNDYGLAELKAEGMSLIGKLEKGESPDTEKGQLGYFVYTNGATNKSNIQKVFKSYLALNDNDFNPQSPSDSGIFTTQLLSNAGDELTRQSLIENDLLRPDGTVREEVGFMGLSKMLMSDPSKLVERLTAGYNVVWEFMQANGLANRYDCVEDYLVDCSFDSLFTVEELATGVDVQRDEEDEFGQGEPFDDGSFMGMSDSFSSSNSNSSSKNEGAFSDIPTVERSSKTDSNQITSPTGENHFKSTVINTPTYSNSMMQPNTKVNLRKETTVRQVMGDSLYNMNSSYLNRIPSSTSLQDSVRSKEVICHKPFQTIDVQRIEPLSELLVPSFFNIEWIANKMCQSKRLSGLGRKIKQQSFYRKAVNKKETKTMLLSIGEAVGGLETITSLDIVDRRIILNNMNFNYCGDILIDNFDVFQFTKLSNLATLGTDVPLTLTKILVGLKCDSVDGLWELFDKLNEVQCMGKVYCREGGIADKRSIFQSEEELQEELKIQRENYEKMTTESTLQSEPEKEVVEEEVALTIDDIDSALSELPTLVIPDEEKHKLIMQTVDELCKKKYNRKLPITVKELPDIDYLSQDELVKASVQIIIDYLNTFNRRG